MQSHSHTRPLMLRTLLFSYCFLLLAFCFSSHAAPTNDSSSAPPQAPSSAASLTVSGFVDAYYAFAFATPPARTRSYTTQPLYHNEFSINFAVLSVAYSSECIRGRFAVQAGSYAESNYAAEPQFWRNIFEANAGYSLTDNLWIDAGIFASHIGFESAFSKDNWNYSRSLVADYSPYFETGAKLTWSPNETWSFTALVLNGWQIIRETNSDKSVGTQIQWKPAPTALVNWSTYVGNDQPDSAARQMRYFNNFYAQLGLGEKLNLAFLFDIGVQQRTSTTTHTWWGGAMIGRYSLTDRITLGVRGEYYSDPNGILIPTGTANNFQVFSASANVDVALTQNLLWRTEGRIFAAREAIYPTENAAPRTNDGFVVTSLAFFF